METDTLSRRVGQLFRILRHERRWTIDQAGDHLGVDPSTLGAYERGARQITLNALFERILQGYGITLLDLAQRLAATEPDPTQQEPNRTERMLALTHIISEASDELAALIVQPDTSTRVA